MSTPEDPTPKDLGLRRLGGDPSVPIIRKPPAPPPAKAETGPSEVLSGYDFNDYRRDAHETHSEGNTALAPEPKAKFHEPEPIEPKFLQPDAPPPRVSEPRYAPMPTQQTGLYNMYGDDEERPKPQPSFLSWARKILTDHPLPVVVGIGILVSAYFVVANMATNRDLTSVSKLKKRAREFDGQTVKVAGRVGEVFQMGSSYAYYLHQGRDTIVVFTRTRTPVPHERLKITGSVSTGYLEGVPRVALFETP